MENKVFEKVTAIIRATVQQPRLNITGNSSSKDVEGWDSLRHLMIITGVEKEFGLKFDFMEILDVKTVDDICKLVMKNK